MFQFQFKGKMCNNLRRVNTMLFIISVFMSGVSSTLCDSDVENENQHCSSRRPLGVPDNEIRMLLIGKTGVGKSTTGNTILGFRAFDTKTSATSVTNQVQFNSSERFQKNLTVVDTPGLFDTNKTNEDVKLEIMKCFGITSPGIHAILLIVPIGRFTEEEKKTVDFFLEVFGKDVKNYLMVVFTGKDNLDYEGTSLENYVESYENTSSLKTLLSEIDGRYTAIGMGGNITEREDEVKQIIGITEEMNMKNNDNGYTNAMYDKAEAILRQKQAERVKEKMDTGKAYTQAEMNRMNMDARKEERINIVNNNQNEGSFLLAFASVCVFIVGKFFGFF